MKMQPNRERHANGSTESLADFKELQLTKHFISELRSDHAGETGAVFMYLGILKISKEDTTRAFASEHLATERRHLQFFDNWLPESQHSVLIPLWKFSGFMLGALAALVGQQFVFTTIKAVETFVDKHYQQQIDYLNGAGKIDEKLLIPMLISFQADEREHKEQAEENATASGRFIRCWEQLIAKGSELAVKAARKL